MKHTSINLFSLVILTFLMSCNFEQNKEKMKNEASEKQFQEIVLKNSNGTKVSIINYGATVTSIIVKDKNGNLGEIVLGYDKPEDYPEGNPYFGATIGRFGNRIAKGKFTLGSNEYQLELNNEPNHLHGGNIGFNNVFWEIIDFQDTGKNQFVSLKYISKDMEEGYPGNLTINLTYTLTEENELVIDYKATTDKSTVLNLTHHSFFNLSNGGKSKILDHELTVYADSFIPVDSTLIPTGEIRTVENTPFDFRKGKKIGADIEADNIQIKYGRGFDHTFVINGNEGSLKLAASVYDPMSGRKMELYTTEPGMQLYTGNFLDGSDIGHNSTPYQFRAAFCLEPQHFPDSPNQDNFPSTVLSPGEVYTQKSVFRFSVEE
ncbi:MAG: galactose-1-epimerase [Bacteroidetes bacterium]|nr:MAG: galactose-1-epimerase [Bacteroidota bacterium]